MYKISVPVTLSSVLRYGIENYIGKLKEMKAERIFISIDSYEVNPEKFENITADLKKTISVFKEAGFETGVWLWTFMIKGDKKYTHITSPNGAVSADQVCPSDEAFRAKVEKKLRELCAEGIYGIGAVLNEKEARERYGYYGDFSFVIDTGLYGGTTFGDSCKHPLVETMYDFSDFQYL